MSHRALTDLAAHRPEAAAPDASGAIRIPPAIGAPAVLLIGDVVLLGLAVLAATVQRIWFADWLPLQIGHEAVAGIVVGALLLPAAYALAGLYPGYGHTAVERLRKRVTVTVLWFGAMILFDRLAQGGQWSRAVLLMTAGMAVVVAPMWDAFAQALLIRRGWWGEPVAVLGPAQRRRNLIDALRAQPGLGWIPVAEAELGARPPAAAAVSLALVVPAGGSADLSTFTDDLPYRRLVVVPDVEGLQSLWISVRDLGSHLGLEIRRNLLMASNRAVKRTVDIALAVLLLVAAAPVVAVAALLVMAVSPGSPFYGQVRAGRDGRPFRVWKLRTMVPNAEAVLEDLIARSPQARAEWQGSMKLRRDPRIIPVIGGPMRRFSIDELPQVWNVLCGEMSFVGPRPLPAYHLALYGPEADRLRQRVRPGITGLWQVSGRSALSIADQQRLDVYYVRNWSLWLDLHILARTVLVVLGGKDAW
ncbi:MAG TPA: exopolysaccharide biosynthesis polyprenyl glycosylphosphotransferase [Alphaproteobacteria bacterium]|nr:exopolysaccharide biosynthesis polyprenyl glycosylphosphotransferase [Alphaproteobacteria bacterium]